jgi:drug/metabolite transporter (DMT)-like permease
MPDMNLRKDNLDGLAVGMLLACCMFWGLQQVLVKAVVLEVAPLFQASLRCIGASVLLLIWCRVRGVRLFEGDGSLWAGLLAGGLFAAEFACIYLGLLHTSASRLTVFLYTAPFWVAALVPLFVKSERLRPMQWLGLACAFVAVVFAMREGMGAHAGEGLAGDLLGLAAGALWGLTTVSIRANNLTRVAPEKLLLYQIGTTALTLPWLSLALGESWSFDWSPMAWG